MPPAARSIGPWCRLSAILWPPSGRHTTPRGHFDTCQSSTHAHNQRPHQTAHERSCSRDLGDYTSKTDARTKSLPKQTHPTVTTTTERRNPLALAHLLANSFRARQLHRDTLPLMMRRQEADGALPRKSHERLRGCHLRNPCTTRPLGRRLPSSPRQSHELSPAGTVLVAMLGAAPRPLICRAAHLKRLPEQSERKMLPRLGNAPGWRPETTQLRTSPGGQGMLPKLPASPQALRSEGVRTQGSTCVQARRQRYQRLLAQRAPGSASRARGWRRLNAWRRCAAPAQHNAAARCIKRAAMPKRSGGATQSSPTVSPPCR